MSSIEKSGLGHARCSYKVQRQPRRSFAAAKRAGLLASFLTSATICTPGLAGSNRPLGRRAALALASDAGGTTLPRWTCSLDPAEMTSLHEQWLGYAFRLAAVLAASAGLSPSAAAAVPPVTPLASGSSAVGQGRDAGAVAASKSGGRGAFVLEDLAVAGAARRSSGGGGPSDGAGSKGANVGIKRLRAAIDGALLAASTAGASVPEAVGVDFPPVDIPKPVLVGDAEVAAYSPLGISAAVAGRLITAAFLHTVDWHFAAIQGEAVRGCLCYSCSINSSPLLSFSIALPTATFA